MRVAISAAVVRVSGCDDVSLTLSRQRDPYDVIRHRQGRSFTSAAAFD
jgi:hypothetical protein